MELRGGLALCHNCSAPEVRGSKSQVLRDLKAAPLPSGPKASRMVALRWTGRGPCKPGTLRNGCEIVCRRFSWVFCTSSTLTSSFCDLSWAPDGQRNSCWTLCAGPSTRHLWVRALRCGLGSEGVGLGWLRAAHRARVRTPRNSTQNANAHSNPITP